jgi:predicted ATPase/signal transduction histidine kinase
MKSKLFKSEEKVVIDKITTSDQETVLAKQVNKNTALENLHHVILKREYNLMKEMRHPNIVEFLDFDDLNSRIHFKNADIETLESLLNYSELTVKELCQMAIQVSKAMEFLWERGIIYNNLNPRSILFNKDDKHYKLINFHNSSNIAKHQENETKLNKIDGDIHFISPEQSGRMNRSIDYRSDIYSLGAVLYAALSGKKLFPEKTLHEVIHAHIAKEPIPIEVHNPKVTKSLSQVIHKMLNKNAEDRYQSAYGIRKDLEDVIAIIEAKKNADDFILGKYDKDSSFEIPEKLYGRDLEIKNVLFSYEDTVGKRNRLLLVNGYSGIGKTALINEVKKPITKHNGQFTFGKFDQLKKSIPFSGFIQALSSLVNDILTEDEHTIFKWRERILEEVGSDSHIITDLIPQLEKIIGKQKKRLEDLTSLEMQNLFNKTLRDFISVFKTSSSPLVLFLDDLQWADNSTINLIKFLVTDPKNNNLLLIAGYRSNEVGVNHPFQVCIDEIKGLGGLVDEVSLDNLTPNDILDLLIDTLKYDYNEESSVEIKDLTNAIYKKTKGNPFFTKNLIKSLHTKGLIYYNEAARQWSWMQDKIELTQISNNLLDLLISNLKEMNKDELKLIKYASIIGASFDSKILTEILDMGVAQFESALYRCIEDDLIIPLDKNYRYIGTVEDDSIVCKVKFSHDKIQQAAYELCSEEEKINAHEKISNYFKDLYKSSENTDIFELSFHLNKLIGKREIDPAFVAEINYKAGLKAQEASAYFAAKDHYEISYQYLPEDRWERFYEFTLNVATALSECYYLCAETEKAEELYNYLLTKAENKDDKAKIYEIQMNYFTNQGRADDAIRVGRKALKLYGINFPEKANMAQVFPKLLRVKMMFFFRKDEDILNNKKLTNTDALAAMKILSNMSPSCFIQSPASMLLNCLNCLILTLKHGNTDVSSYVISLMGFVEAVALSNYERAHELMKLATAIGDKFDPEQKYKSKLIFSWNNFVQFYHAPIVESTNWLRKGHAAGINCGDFNFANYCLYSLFSRELFLGYNLKEVYKNSIEYSQFADSISDQYIIPMMQIMRRFISLMNNEYDSNFIERDQSFNVSQFIKDQEDNHDHQNLAWLYVFDSIRHYIHEEYDMAFQSSINAEVHGEDGAQKQIILFEHYFYAVLIASKEIKKGKNTRAKALKHAQVNLKKIEQAAKTMPQNFRARYHLAKAAFTEATQPNNQESIYLHYHKAIDYANIDKFTQIEAIACENFALYLEQFDSHGYCRFLNKKAYEGYKKWGALNKLRLLDYRISITVETHEIDIETKTFIETAHHISSVRDVEELILKIIETGIQYSNAQSGILVTKEKNGLLVHGNKENFPKVLIDYVLNTGDVIRLDTLEQQERFIRDNYFKKNTPQSVIALPLTASEQTNAVLYLENQTTKGVFTKDKTEVLEVITTQMALALENAIILRDLEKIVSQRTQELEKKRSELELSYKEKETLIRVLCHDLANIVMANKAALRRVTREIEPQKNEKVESYVQRLSLSLKSEAYIINNVRSMELAKKNNLMLKFEQINLIEAMVNSIDTFEEQALSKNIKINIDDRIRNAQVYCDKISLSVNVLNNIFNNAIKFSYEDGEIDVNFIREDEELFQFEIRDHGIGMTKDFRESLFKNTYHESTKGTSQERGSGFGLGIIKFYIDKFDGELDIKSIHQDECDKEHGTSIKITLRKGPNGHEPTDDN